MELPLLPDIVIILGLSVLVVLVFQKLKLPAILGFLITGMIVGPHGFDLIEAIHEVELLSEIGIIFLLFVIGIEFSLRGLNTIKKTVLIGGGLQVLGTIAAVTGIAHYMGLPLGSAVFMGFLLSLSSTAIVLKMLQENGELTSPHGRVSIAILIFQDIVVVLMMLLTPLLAGESEKPGEELLWLLLKVSLVIGGVILLARYVVPVLLKLVVKTKNRELFILAVIVICFSTAWLTSFAGLSLALGAFFAGLVISESDYSHQATANILPFREIFISFFFVSVGMLLNIGFFLDHVVWIHLIAFGVLVIKILIILPVVLTLNYPMRTAILTALALFQVGEFAFLLSMVGMQHGLLSETVYQYFLAISIITMGASPFVINYSPAIASFLLRAPLPKGVRNRLHYISQRKEAIRQEEERFFHDHIVIIGYGVNGQNVAKAARRAGIPYVVVDLDPDVIKKAKKKNDHVVFGDATSDLILKHVHVQDARVVVIATSSNEATKKIIRMIRLFTDTTYVIVRTRYVKEIDDIMLLGADEVITEEFEASIEIFIRVLRKYLVTDEEITNFIREIRANTYKALREETSAMNGLNGDHLDIPDMEMVALRVYRGRNRIVGHSLRELHLRSEYGVTLLAIKRGDEFITNLDQDLVISQDDVLYVFGRHEDIRRVNRYFTF